MYSISKIVKWIWFGSVIYRVGNYKLIEGYAGPYNGWYPVPTSEEDGKVEEPIELGYYQLYDVLSKFYKSFVESKGKK